MTFISNHFTTDNESKILVLHNLPQQPLAKKESSNNKEEIKTLIHPTKKTKKTNKQ